MAIPQAPSLPPESQWLQLRVSTTMKIAKIIPQLFVSIWTRRGTIYLAVSLWYSTDTRRTLSGTFINGLSIYLVGTLNQVTITISYSNPLVSYNAIQSFQEYSTVSTWSPIQAIVFTNNTMPVQPTSVSPPVVLSSSMVAATPSNNSATANVVTDLVTNSVSMPPRCFTH